MDEAKILELARAAGMQPVLADGLCYQSSNADGWVNEGDLLAFARLVAAAERERAARIVLDDMMAVTYQTMGKYRTGLAYHIMGVDSPQRVLDGISQAQAIRSRTE